MGEPKRWKIHLNRVGAITDYGTVGDEPHNTVHVREDRATEIDRHMVALRLAEWAGDTDDFTANAGGAREEYNDQASELLALVFGEETSRV